MADIHAREEPRVPSFTFDVQSVMIILMVCCMPINYSYYMTSAPLEKSQVSPTHSYIICSHMAVYSVLKAAFIKKQEGGGNCIEYCIFNIPPENGTKLRIPPYLLGKNLYPPLTASCQET